MTGEAPQDEHLSKPPEGDQRTESRGGDSSALKTAAMAKQSHRASGDANKVLNSSVPHLGHDVEPADHQTRTPAAASHDPIESAANRPLQSIPLILPEGGNPADHLTPAQLLAANKSRRMAREVELQAPDESSLRQPARYEKGPFAPAQMPTFSDGPASEENTKPLSQSSFQSFGTELPGKRLMADASPTDVSVALPDEPATATSHYETGNSSLLFSNASDKPPTPEHLFQSASGQPTGDFIARLSEPQPNSRTVAASREAHSAIVPPPTPGAATAQPSLAEEKIAPLPRVIVMVGLDEADKIVHEEMRAFSQELATVGRQIAREEVDTMMFEFRAQLNALLR